MNTKIKFEKANEKAIVPNYAHDGDSGLDLYSVSEYVIDPKTTCLVDTGIKLQIPYGFEGQVRSKSGLALKNSLFVLNSPGTIDSTYRGNIMVILHNLGEVPYTVEYGKKIAQLVITPVQYVELIEEFLEDTHRNNNGFGSTGLNNNSL